MFLSNKIKNYLAKYENKELKMSREIKNFLNLQTMVEVKVDHCTTSGVIYSIYFSMIKLVFSKDKNIIDLVKNNNLTSIQFKSLINVGKDFDKIILPVKFLGTVTYSAKNRECNLVTLRFLNPLFDDLVIKIGKLLDLKYGHRQRIHERIMISKKNINKLCLNSNKTILIFNHKKYDCSIRDLSYCGALVVSYIEDSFDSLDEILLHLSFNNLDKEILMRGKIKNLNTIQTPNGKVFALGVSFLEESIPIEYTIAIHNFFNE